MLPTTAAKTIVPLVEALLLSNGSSINITDGIVDSTTILNGTHEVYKRSVQNHIIKHAECRRTNIMGSLVQNASPFLFPCTIEYSLICAVILFEMWKKVKSIPNIVKTRKNSLKNLHQRNAHHFSIDCSR